MPRILLVEDSPDLRRTIRELLRLAGLEVETAGNGEEALERFRQQPFDLVITDVVMPKVGGADTIRGLRALAPGIKIVAIYGGGRIPGTASPATAESLGADRMLHKPFSAAELTAAVAELMHGPEAGPGPR